MKKTALWAIFLTASLLFCSACAKEEQQEQEEPLLNVIYLHDLYTEINENALPPLETSELSVTPPPGTRPSVERLFRAPQDLVGTQLNISVDLSSWSDAACKEFVYCFEKRENQKGWLSILYSVDPAMKGAIMLTLETNYESAEQLLAETKVWSGTVTSVNIVSIFDYMYPRQTVAGAKRDFVQSSAGPICYGWARILENGAPTERLCFSCNSMDEISPFKITFERFGLLT